MRLKHCRSCPAQVLDPPVAASFSLARLTYDSFNTLLRQLLPLANAGRREIGLLDWPMREVHWHMFRHGHVMMALIFDTPESEVVRSLRMKLSTLEVYRAHVKPLFDQLLHEATQHSGVERRVLRNNCLVLAKALSQGDEAGEWGELLLSFCEMYKVTPAGLHNMPQQLRQVPSFLQPLASQHCPFLQPRPPMCAGAPLPGCGARSPARYAGSQRTGSLP